MQADIVNGRRPSFIAAQAALASLATLFTVARFIAKRIRHFPTYSEDWYLIIALVFMYACVALHIAATAIGVQSSRFISGHMGELERTLFLLWFVRIPHAVALTLIRCSISILFIRTFCYFTHHGLRRTAYLCLLFSIAWFVVTVTVVLTNCRPIYHNWKVPAENEKYCFPLRPFTAVVLIWGLTLDAVIWTLPLCVIWRLRLPRVQKIGVSTMFALGLVNVVIAVLRLTSLLYRDNSGDITYDAFEARIWAIAQIGTAIMLASCPLLHPVFELLIPRKWTRIGFVPLNAIRVTTRIEIFPDSMPWTPNCFVDDILDTEGPTFEIDRGHGLTCC
ncbi:hypothetical protein BDV95DRAFT_378296 [Massariosphaeria phaeospora]|uniref:Rhodopsin domain-containing protein n=1 Tax=Massariosphaeria phaeospora TaxID=100035 RepID=A0A7C8MAZ5_9PLEO|nr:hypothetical protein BDV95DRAFT_378296 [Massariosphaeria phaeospora]